MISNVLVIGGSGFLGSNVVRSLNSTTAVSVSSADLIYDANCISNFYPLDILDKTNIYSIAKNFDIIINCTGQITKPIDRCKDLNSIGIKNICTVANELDIRLIHISSVAVYGSVSECSENNSLNPETMYGKLKVDAENEIISSMKNNKFVILRVPNLYGSSQKKGIISYIIKSLTSDRKLNFNNDGNMFRTFLSVSDCSYIISKVVHNNDLYGIYNIGSDDSYSIISLVDEIERILFIKFDVNYSLDIAKENIRKIDYSKIMEKLNIDWNRSSLLSYISSYYNER